MGGSIGELDNRHATCRIFVAGGHRRTYIMGGRQEDGSPIMQVGTINKGKQNENII